MVIKNAFIFYIILINIVAYCVMWFDKYQSKKKGSRVPENRLFFIAILLGAVGIYFGMKTPLFHKTGKISFKIGMPILIILNTLCIYFIIKTY
jgi:uncharacterized membrane protein YsdA (DUF1294 family)